MKEAGGYQNRFLARLVVFCEGLSQPTVDCPESSETILAKALLLTPSGVCMAPSHTPNFLKAKGKSAEQPQSETAWEELCSLNRKDNTGSVSHM